MTESIYANLSGENPGFNIKPKGYWFFIAGVVKKSLN
jgi:hypothetical protein